MAGFLGRLFKREKRGALFCTAVVAAAGSSARMEGQDKLFLPIGDYPVLYYALRALEESPHINEIVVVTREDLVVPAAQLCKDFGLQKVTKVITGGDTRSRSVYLGVCEASAHAALIAIHDGARPFLSGEVIAAAVEKAADCGAAAPAVPVKDTVKAAHGGVVTETLLRETLFAVQTPQVFEASLIKAALQRALEENATVTDDCAAVERLGMSVCLTPGSDENIKITTPADYAAAVGILEWREER